ncbi:MAG: outer membrane protein assembly factor BamD [Smithellaceae bacterium]
MTSGYRLLKTAACLLLIILLLTGCASTRSSIKSFFIKEPRVKMTPESLYARGTQEFQIGSYKKAREFYIRLKEEYPLHEMAILAELGVADAYYSDKEYLEAESAYRDFLIFHPTNENVPYAMYQIGMCHYQQIGAIDRDQTETIKARQEFERLVARFPKSQFATLAEKMIRDCKQKLAEHEFYVGSFYFKHKKYDAALQRFETIQREYAGVGLDYRVERYIEETRARIEKMKSKEVVE